MELIQIGLVLKFEEGSLLCWMDSIVHYTYPNGSDVNRLVLSWNMTIVDENGGVLE